jgi:hypothetical protein
MCSHAYIHTFQFCRPTLWLRNINEKQLLIMFSGLIDTMLKSAAKEKVGRVDPHTYIVDSNPYYVCMYLRVGFQETEYYNSGDSVFRYVYGQHGRIEVLQVEVDLT